MMRKLFAASMIGLCCCSLAAAQPPVMWMSFDSVTLVPGIGNVNNEDLVSFDEGSGLWTWEFDGSDVGLATLEISGLAMILPGGDLLLSFTEAGTVDGLSIDDSDIVRFSATSSGSNTAGTFSLYFDGSDVGLSDDGEDIDAITLSAGGDLIVSTTGDFSGAGATGSDEDLFLFSATSLGPTTVGSFALLFDGSEGGLGGDDAADLDAVHRTGSGLVCSTEGDFAVGGIPVADEDVVKFEGDLGTPASGTYSNRKDLSTLGIPTASNVRSLHLIPTVPVELMGFDIE